MIKESTVKRFPGSVVLPDDLTYLQGIAYARAYRQAKALGEEASMAEFIHAMLPGICACVVEWHIDGLPAVVTPEVLEQAKPARAVAELMSWLFSETTALYVKSEDVPNG